MKKLFSLWMAGLMMIGLVACGAPASPKSTVESYFNAAKKLDSEAMSRQILPENTEAIAKTNEALVEAEDDSSKVFLDYLKANAAKMTYEITNVDESGDNAVVTIKSRYVNGAPVIQSVMEEAISKMFESAFSSQQPTEEETSKLFTDLMKEKQGEIEETFLTQTLQIPLVKSNGKWYINEVEDKMLDVVTSGFVSVFAGMADAFNN